MGFIKTFYDLETTGFSALEGDDVIQAAYATFDGLNPIRSGVLHFYYPEMKDSSAGAVEKHHMPKAYLAQFEGDFKKNKQILWSILSGANVVGFNNIHFDDEFLKYWFNRMGAPTIVFKRSLDVMRMAKPLTAGNRISLVNLCKRFGFTEEMINKQSEEWFGLTGTAHTAYYDVAATAMCYFEEVKRGMVLEESPVTETDPETESADYINDLDDIMNSEAQEVVKTYEEGCRWYYTIDGYIPTCSDKSIYLGDPVNVLPEGKQAESVMFPERTSDNPRTYVLKDGDMTFTLTCTDKENSMDIDIAGFD